MGRFRHGVTAEELSFRRFGCAKCCLPEFLWRCHWTRIRIWQWAFITGYRVGRVFPRIQGSKVRSGWTIAEPGRPKNENPPNNRRVRAQAQDETCSHRVETPAERPPYSIYRIPFAEGEADCGWWEGGG